MGNSTRSIQSIFDYIMTMGDVRPLMPTGGFALQPALSIANDVIREMLSQHFNWKYNRIVVPPFYTNSWQQDYGSSATNIGWLEHCCIVDINNTSQPKPIDWIECVRDLERSSVAAGQPTKICWQNNDQLVSGTWPGASQLYTTPIGATSMPANGPTMILDANGNILKLTTYGTTGLVAPVLAASSAAGTTVADGSCVWTVLDPKAQGFRIAPIPSQTGTVWQINVTGQGRPPVFTSLSQVIDPVPDDQSHHFTKGCISYATRHSAAPAVRATHEAMRREWLQSLADERGAAAREKEDAAFIPAHNIMDGAPAGAGNLGPLWPYGPR